MKKIFDNNFINRFYKSGISEDLKPNEDNSPSISSLNSENKSFMKDWWPKKLKKYHKVYEINKGDYALIYHEFLNGLNEFNFKSKYSEEKEKFRYFSYKCLFLSNHEELTPYVEHYITKHKESIISKEKFYLFLDNFQFGYYTENIFEWIYERLAEEIISSYNYLTGVYLNYYYENLSYYKTYPAFPENELDFKNMFLIENILQNISFESYNAKFEIKEGYQKEITRNILNKSTKYIYNNPNKFNYKIIKNEIIRLKSIPEGFSSMFIKEHINQLKELIEEFSHRIEKQANSHYDVFENNKLDNSKKLSKEQNQFYINILKKLFKNLTQKEATKLIKLEIDKEVFLKGKYKPYSQLLCILIHENYYTKSQVEEFLLSEKIRFWSKENKTGVQLVSQNRVHGNEFKKAKYIITLPKNKNSIEEKHKLIEFQKLLNTNK